MQPLPALLAEKSLQSFANISKKEHALLTQAASLFNDGYFDHALLDVWNAAVSNLRRRIEAYSTELFLSVIKEEAGRKKYDKDGETPSERWAGVDDLVLITGCSQLGVLNKKAGKALEMINWMRNHASPAHDSDQKVEQEDVVALVLLLEKNLFGSPLPDPAHSVAGIFEPVKKKPLDETAADLLKAEIQGLRPADIRTAFGFMLDVIIEGKEPAYANAIMLFPEVWERANEDIRKTAGLKYHGLVVAGGDEAKETKTRILQTLVEVDGIGYIPEGARSTIYKKAAATLAKAKDTSYGWTDELRAARSLAQFGPHVPKIAFEQVYQEILAVWFGNFWGHSGASEILKPFIDKLDTQSLRRVVDLIRMNERVRSEFVSSKPKAQARNLLKSIRGRFSLESHKNDVDDAIFSLSVIDEE